jgi:cystathionine beta-lyase/cystathionine gamma-synthase/D-alanyl-D-alanine dipeptidase
MGERLDTEAVLVPVTGIRPALQHHLQGLPGAVRWPFLAEPARKALLRVAARVAKEGLELVLLDTHRARPTQLHLHDALIKALPAYHPDLDEQEILALTVELVGERDGVFPHGTGGAVGVTLARDGTILDLGSEFGDLGERSAADYFHAHAPETPAELDAATRRELLLEQMCAESFVGDPKRWWAYEWGTARWADVLSRDALLDEVLPPPQVDGPTARPPLVPARFPVWQPGLAQPLLSVEERAAAHMSRPPGHLYARQSHPGRDELAGLLTREILGGEGAALCSSGLAAVRHAIGTLMGKGDVLLYTKDVYHGSKQLIRRMARAGGWIAEEIVEPLDWLNRTGNRAKVVFVDSPSSWHMRCHDLPALAAAAQAVQARLVVDVTVQPCQRALGMGADVVVCSLSKDISYGNTSGGAIVSSDRVLLGRLLRSVDDSGEVLAGEAVQTIHQHALSTRDRLYAAGAKAEVVKEFLRAHPAVVEVFEADPNRCGGMSGSQLAFQLCDPTQGLRLERAVAQRALDPDTALHLMGTFGTHLTSLEHFGSTLGWVDDRVKTPIPRDRVRLSLGHETAERIVAELEFVLGATWTGRDAAPGSGSALQTV